MKIYEYEILVSKARRFEALKDRRDKIGNALDCLQYKSVDIKLYDDQRTCRASLNGADLPGFMVEFYRMLDAEMSRIKNKMSDISLFEEDEDDENN